VSLGLNQDLNTSDLLAGVGRTTSQNTADLLNSSFRGVKVWVVTSAIGTGSITVTIQGKDPGSGTYTTLLAGVAIITNTTNVYTVYPGLPATANVSANDILPRVWRISVVANNANPATYSIGASLIV
jgi:hypothetical protein